MKRVVLALSILMVFAIGLAGCGGAAQQQNPAPSTQTKDQGTQPPAPAKKKYKIATVVKLTGVAWFNRMEEGVKKFAKETGNDAFEVGPPQADAALQVKMIEDLIAQKVDAICVVPNSPEALEPVLKRARDAGIVVIAHEASNAQNVDYDIEAFDNTAYGAHFMDQLAKAMGEKGEYGVFVGFLTSKSHNEWVDGAIARQKEKYPNMKLGVDKIETAEDQQKAYEKTKELLKAHPSITGLQGSAMTDVPGAARAVEEMGLTGKVHVIGTSLVSVAGDYLKSGAADSIGFWDPADAGYAMNKLAVTVLEKKQVATGLDLGLPGYDKLTLKGKVLSGQAWVDVTKANAAKYNF